MLERKFYQLNFHSHLDKRLLMLQVHTNPYSGWRRHSLFGHIYCYSSAFCTNRNMCGGSHVRVRFRTPHPLTKFNILYDCYSPKNQWNHHCVGDKSVSRLWIHSWKWLCFYPWMYVYDNTCFVWCLRDQCQKPLVSTFCLMKWTHAMWTNFKSVKWNNPPFLLYEYMYEFTYIINKTLFIFL